MLPDWHVGDTMIVVPFPDRATMPRKIRIFLDAMATALDRARTSALPLV